MRIITNRAINEFCTVHPQAKASFDAWRRAVRMVNWRTWAELRATFRSADRHRSCVVFNVGGNHYRLIGWVRYSRQLDGGRWSLGKIFVRHVLTHAEYDRDTWKEDCS